MNVALGIMLGLGLGLGSKVNQKTGGGRFAVEKRLRHFVVAAKRNLY